MRHQPRLRPMLSPLTAALLAALVVVGCESAPDLSGRPTEADEPVIRISRFKTGDDASVRLAALPVGTIYGDGRDDPARPRRSPSSHAPALPSLQVTTLDSAGVDAVLAKAAAAGLVGADRELRMPTEATPRSRPSTSSSTGTGDGRSWSPWTRSPTTILVSRPRARKSVRP